MKNNFKRIKLACYSGNFSMAVIANISPLLFLTFKDTYNISYSLLGLLVLINFLTQLSVDLVFSFFSYKFNIPLAIKITPLLTFFGLLIFGAAPFILPNNVYIGLVIGTVLFSASGGFGEVLISPLIAALPAKNPDSEVSKLHSVYAWSVVIIVLISTLFFVIFGMDNWQYLIFFFLLCPLVTFILYFKQELPELSTPEKVSGAITIMKNKELWLCVIAIFLGGIMEQTMAQWCSGYLEKAIGISKVYGDIFGVALFAVMLGLGRSLYSKYGKSPERILFLGASGSFICYLVAAISPIPLLGLFACAFTGLCVSMLWPGSLLVSASRIPVGGVFVYALMASGGDLGASIGPQLVGVVTDFVSQASFAEKLATEFNITIEQIAMKTGILVGAFFSLIATFVFFIIYKTRRTKKDSI